jgi:NAD(P)-dependent dehydrogenase (short-subunit alcohol dehydrogenase family)
VLFMTFLPNGLDLSGKVCVVTGAGSGIGQSIAIALALEGAKVAILDRRTEGLDATKMLITDAGGICLPVLCDISDETDVESASKTISKVFGNAEVLVNNAAVVWHGPLEDCKLANWNNLIAVNLTGYFLCSQIFSKGMRAQNRGSIIHISSVMSSYPQPGAGAYSITKAGIQMLSRQIAAEWGPHGIRSNTVNPCLVVTPLSQHIYDRPGVREIREAAVPLRRIGLPDDIARTVLFLASPLADYISGQEIHVDGGVQANLMGLIPRPSPNEP